MARELSKFQKKLIIQGVCDQRGAAFCATASKLPNGEFGMCLLAVNGSVLSIYDTDMKSSVGDLLYTVDLKKISNLKINGNFFAELIKGYSMRFTYKKHTYTFKNCFSMKQCMEVIRDESK